jgi:hypothetical protein
MVENVIENQEDAFNTSTSTAFVVTRGTWEGIY